MNWKNSTFASINKKMESRHLPSNCMSVSFTSVVIKIPERTFRKAVMTVVETNNLSDREQHDFMKGLSCTINLLMAIEQ